MAMIVEEIANSALTPIALNNMHLLHLIDAEAV